MAKVFSKKKKSKHFETTSLQRILRPDACDIDENRKRRDVAFW
jgi:hypothetical protein